MGLETLVLASTAMSVFGSVAGGVGAMQAASFNAKMAEQEAEAARQQAALEAGRVRETGRKILGAQRAATAKAGLEVGEGSPLLIMLETVRQSEEDAMLTRYKGDVRATSLRAEARAQRAEGRRALLGGILGAASEGLKGAALLKFTRQR